MGGCGKNVPYIVVGALLGVFGVVFCLTSFVVVAPFALILGWLCCSSRRVDTVQGAHVVVTGGSSGIGLAIAKKCAARGARHITLVARNVQRLEAAKLEVESTDVSRNSRCEVAICSLDLVAASDEEVHRAVLESVPERRVDLLICSAGDSGQPEIFEHITSDSWEQMFRLNVLGCVKATKAVLPGMRLQDRGHICLIGSMASQAGIYGLSGYSASKFGVRGFAEVLRMELADSAVSVSLCCPPDTDTPMLERENATKPLVTQEISKGAGLWSADQVADGTLDGIDRRHFFIGFGLDGFMLNIVTVGFGPVQSPLGLVIEVTLLPLFRMVALVYLWSFDRIVRKHGGARPSGLTAPFLEHVS